jgi:hypothetical protein
MYDDLVDSDFISDALVDGVEQVFCEFRSEGSEVGVHVKNARPLSAESLEYIEVAHLD